MPDYPFNPAKLGFPLKRYFLADSPGFWPDHSEKFDFPYLICFPRSLIQWRDMQNGGPLPDTQECLDGIALLSSFGWLNAIAADHGFTPYDELTYPFVTHAIITDGQRWSFYVYQLNTHSFHRDVDTNELKNLCWSSGEMKLFESYENGEFRGINDEVIKNLVKVKQSE